MKLCSFLQLTQKEVINLCTGENLGCIHDLEINTAEQKVVSIVLPGKGGLLGIGKQTEIVIPWCKIECIGEDAILVRLNAEEFSCCCIPKRKTGRSIFGK
ncbi:MAG: YlmC/YmxH family sporulation protein [Clostridia bacterium]|nr:YlmC/YmxH family sporulation protein [Clostridia bacterium]